MTNGFFLMINVSFYLMKPSCNKVQNQKSAIEII